jgi:hypothetical protein
MRRWKTPSSGWESWRRISLLLLLHDVGSSRPAGLTRAGLTRDWQYGNPHGPPHHEFLTRPLLASTVAGVGDRCRHGAACNFSSKLPLKIGSEYQRNGFSSLTPVPRKSLIFRVTTFMS